MGELAMSPEETEREKEKNAIYSGHLRFWLQHKGSAHTLLGPTKLFKSRQLKAIKARTKTVSYPQ